MQDRIVFSNMKPKVAHFSLIRQKFFRKQIDVCLQ